MGIAHISNSSAPLMCAATGLQMIIVLAFGALRMTCSTNLLSLESSGFLSFRVFGVLVEI